MRKRPFLRLSLVIPCSYWFESSLTFSASRLHVGLVQDLLKLTQHCRFRLRQYAVHRRRHSSVALLQLYAMAVSNQGAFL
jgi:hypothetical protein